MKPKAFHILIAGVFVAFLSRHVRAQTVAYNNTTTYSGASVLVVGIAVGSEVTLSGSSREVTGVSVLVESAAETPVNFSAKLSLYINDGFFGGSPGTLLWESPYTPESTIPGVPKLISFEVPNVTVPETFIWIADFTGWDSQVGLSQYYPPTIGSVRMGFWRSSQGPASWVFIDQTSPCGARINVRREIPTTSFLGLLVLAMALLVGGIMIIRRCPAMSRPQWRPAAGVFAIFVLSDWMPPVAAQVQVGPQIRIDVSGGTAPANETSIGASDLNLNEIVAAWNDNREGLYTYRIGVGVSQDGGASWSDFLVRPPPANQGQEADPMTAYDDRTGTLWVGGLSIDNDGGIFVARKIAGQSGFHPSVMAYLTTVADRGTMGAGPVPGNPNATNLYIAFNLGFLRSTTMGDTWSGLISLATGKSFLPRVGPSGQVYVAYVELDPGDGLMLVRSFDGGQSFGSPIRVATRLDNWGLGLSEKRFPGTFRVPIAFHLAVDKNDGTLYGVYSDAPPYVPGVNSNVDLYFTKSTDQGLTWTTPAVINGEGDPPGDQFFPWIEVDEDSNTTAL